MPAIVLPALEVQRATPRTRIIRLGLGDTPFAYAAGQAVMVGLHHGSVRKPYSLASSPGHAARRHALELLAEVQDDADVVDPHLEQVLPGTLVDVDGPFGTFTLPERPTTREFLFVAGGTGIAPLRAMLWDALERRLADRLALIYSARTIDELAYRTELTDLAAAGRLDLRLTVTREAPTRAWDGLRGRIDYRLLAATLRTPETSCFVCGPASFVSDLTVLLERAGVPAAAIARERYL